MTYQVETRCLRREPPIVELSVQAGAFLDYDPVLYVLEASERPCSEPAVNPALLREQGGEAN